MAAGEHNQFAPVEIDEAQAPIPGIEFAINMAEFRARHVGQGVLDLEGVSV